jgi:hypothetical protein
LFRPDQIKRCGVNSYGKCFHIIIFIYVVLE